MKIRTYLLAFLLVFAACEKNNDDPNVNAQIDDVGTELVKSGNTFSFNLFQKVNEMDTENENIFISPLSVSIALAMTFNGAEGETEEAFKEVLGFADFSEDEINSAYKNLIAVLTTIDPKVTMQIANSIWYRESGVVLDEFVDNMTEYYDAEIRPSDFTNPEMVDIINAWCADKTNDKIKEILDEIPPSIYMYLINAIYFKGTWQYEFDEDETTDKPFYLKNGTSISVKAMRQEAKLKYASNNLFSAVKLPYGDGNFNMIVFLPQDGVTNDEVISTMSDENWATWMTSFEEREKVLIQLPKLKFEYGVKLLNDELKDMGLEIAFGSGADFSGMNGSGGMFISRVMHKTFVEVNEEGTEAAAVTIVEMLETSAPGDEKTYFTVEKPYVFAITEKSTDAILFVGKINKPVIE